MPEQTQHPDPFLVRTSDELLREAGITAEIEAKLRESPIFLEAQRLIQGDIFSRAINDLAAIRISQLLPEDFRGFLSLSLQSLSQRPDSSWRDKIIQEINNNLLADLHTLNEANMKVLLGQGMMSKYNDEKAIAQQLLIAAMHPDLMKTSQPYAVDYIKSTHKGLEMAVREIPTSGEHADKYRLLRLSGMKRGKVIEILVIINKFYPVDKFRDEWGARWMDQTIK